MTYDDVLNVQGDIFLMNDDYKFKCAYRGIWFMLRWRLKLRMTDILQLQVYLINRYSAVILPVQGVIPSTKYYIESKYR
jgi:hypothetical protein